MITKVKKGKDIFLVATQQYELGLYVAIYRNGSIFEQIGLQDITEEQFHTDIKDGKFFKGKIEVLAE